MANKMEMRNACTHMSCQLETHKIFYFFVSVSFFMRNTQIQQQRNQHEPSQKQKIEHTSWPKRMGNITYIEKGIPKWRGENTSFKRRQIESLRRFAVQVIAGYYYGIDVIQTSDDGRRTDPD